MLFLTDRWAEIIFYAAGGHFLKQMQYCPSLCPMFSLFILFMDDLTETFATEAKNSSLYAGNLVILGPLLQTHTRLWKDYKKPNTERSWKAYKNLQRHRVNTRYLLVTSLKCKSFFRLDLHQALYDPQPIYSALPFFQLSSFINNSQL